MKLAVLAFGLALTVWAEARPLQLADLPPHLRPLFPSDFTAYLGQIDSESKQRMQEGEWDHLVHYVLLSSVFTQRDPVEPAISAREYFAARQTVPPAVTARMEDFLRAPVKGERMRYFRELSRGGQEEVVRQYRRAMGFLQNKEVGSRSRQGEQRRAYVASLYQTRGHSTDTSLDASFTTDIALTVLHSMRPAAIVRRALVVGPGLDFAPRTALSEEDPPQSPQPFLLADSLLASKLSTSDLQVRCVDINPRVTSHLTAFGEHPFLHLRWQPEEDEQRAYHQRAGSAIGQRKGNLLTVRDALSRRVTAAELNVLTHRLHGERFDLIVATNVLVYFGSKELLLAMSSIRAMLQPGGFFLHNDTRSEVETYGKALGMPAMHARMVRLSERRQLYDAIVLHESGRPADP